MKTIIAEIETTQKATELIHLLRDLKSVRSASVVSKRKDLITALIEHESIKSAIVKRKNPAIIKYL
ncbi:MAG: hypothetical protein A3H98_10695 [Bacteroidetes bacterium RIFCSPLOWO2_02_FULL_36_8]|nr:MAG: hypothetical protein A3H98_10695 [Bacteroidetes bacterium RIFCSPLOWO2_02_FULL_36_8]OFY69767.1 MAG: hypothetical protein A3G23_11480 [Bacteroidetes bacterium RIFCSPLOWO2_12_FULL_37_12]